LLIGKKHSDRTEEFQQKQDEKERSL